MLTKGFYSETSSLGFVDYSISRCPHHFFLCTERVPLKGALEGADKESVLLSYQNIQVGQARLQQRLAHAKTGAGNRRGGGYWVAPTRQQHLLVRMRTRSVATASNNAREVWGWGRTDQAAASTRMCFAATHDIAHLILHWLVHTKV